MMGINDSKRTYGGQVYRFVVYLFIHINLIHFISNMIILVLLVSRLEYSFGFIRILVLYLLTGIAGAALSNIVYSG